ncbi:MAG: F0F1 ATP synthase subunit B [Gemmatimonadales bacterium]|jgi:F-type H+-transporting ATPase subunit b
MPLAAFLLAAAEEAPKGPFALTPGVSLWTLVIFFILLVVLAKTAWPAILKAVEEREKKIQAQLDDAAKANAEAQRVLTVYQQQLAAAREEAGAILAASRQAGERLREDLVTKGRAEQEELLVRARREIGLEKDKALGELRSEAVELSIAAASKVIERNMDNATDRGLVQDYLDHLESSRS